MRVFKLNSEFEESSSRSRIPIVSHNRSVSAVGTRFSAKLRVHWTCDAGRAGAQLPSEALHPIRSSDVLLRIARERVPCATRCENASKCATSVAWERVPPADTSIPRPPRRYVSR